MRGVAIDGPVQTLECTMYTTFLRYAAPESLETTAARESPVSKHCFVSCMGHGCTCR